VTKHRLRLSSHSQRRVGRENCDLGVIDFVADVPTPKILTERGLLLVVCSSSICPSVTG
jgi:hypothetical protein